MGKVFAEISASLDGFVAGPNVGLDNGMGDGGEALHDWMFRDGGKHRRKQVEELFGSTGAVIVGRRMFDVGEKHWGDNTFFGRPVFVVTHRPKATITKQDGTTYTFVTDGIERVMAEARDAAGDRDVVVLGGAAIIQECIRAGLLEELRLHLVHMLLGGGTSLYAGMGPASLALERTRLNDADGVTHYTFRVTRPG